MTRTYEHFKSNYPDIKPFIIKTIKNWTKFGDMVVRLNDWRKTDNLVFEKLPVKNNYGLKERTQYIKEKLNEIKKLESMTDIEINNIVHQQYTDDKLTLDFIYEEQTRAYNFINNYGEQIKKWEPSLTNPTNFRQVFGQAVYKEIEKQLKFVHVPNMTEMEEQIKKLSPEVYRSEKIKDIQEQIKNMEKIIIEEEQYIIDYNNFIDELKPVLKDLLKNTKKRNKK